MNELVERRPILAVQSGDVVSIDGSKVGFGHGIASGCYGPEAK